MIFFEVPQALRMSPTNVFTVGKFVGGSNEIPAPQRKTMLDGLFEAIESKFEVMEK